MQKCRTHFFQTADLVGHLDTELSKIISSEIYKGKLVIEILSRPVKFDWEQQEHLNHFIKEPNENL